MKKIIFVGLSVLTVLLVGAFLVSSSSDDVVSEPTPAFLVAPVQHASFGLTFAELNILNDPVGELQLYAGLGMPDVIFISDVHSDHFDVDTLAGVVSASTTIIAPRVVFDELPAFLKDKTIVMAMATPTRLVRSCLKRYRCTIYRWKARIIVTFRELAMDISWSQPEPEST